MEVDEELDIKDEDSFSNSPEEGSSDEDAEEERVSQLQKEVEASPYTYEPHVQLISLCRKLGDLESLRKARENMSKLFPLTPELWLDWLEDEKKLATSPEQKENLTTLFERALKDYPSVSVWLEYVQFSIGKVGDSWDAAGVKSVRETFEKAITSVGIHVTQGCLIWEAYREFETIYLLHVKCQGATPEEIKEQEERIFNIFKRQLSIPLLDMDKTFEEFKEVHAELLTSEKSVNYSYQKALKKLEQLKRYEEALYTTETPHYEEYKQYIQFEKVGGEPIRIQNIYERALIENCLKEDIWLDYTKYVDSVVKIKEMSLPIHERAVRNCPWSAQLWCSYCRALERYGEQHAKVIETFETALVMGFTKEEDFKELWLAYLDYLRRRHGTQVENTETKSDFREISDVFDRAITQMKEYFWGSESEYSIVKYWIFFNVKYKKEIDTARKLWRELIDHGHKAEARVWLEFANFERLYGDATHYSKTLLQALSSAADWQETFVDLLVTFEREEGTLESLERAFSKCETQMKCINEKRLKRLEEAAINQEKDDRRRQMSKRPSRGSRDERVNKTDSKVPIQMDSEGFKIPPPPAYRQSPDSRQENNESEKKKRAFVEENERRVKKVKMETTESHGEVVKHDSSKDDRTVFLSNLAYEVDEEKIKESFSQIGEIEEVRLVKDYKGRSKGFCYVVYKSRETANAALAKDRELLLGRPVLVSPCEDRKNNPASQPKFKFAIGLERNKLFVKGLPFSTTQEDVENMFKEFGSLKQVRLVTYRNGHSKGIAYVDFKEESAAANAVVKMDGAQVMEKVISVAISNPPPRKPKKEFSGVRIADSLGGGGGMPKGPRGRGRTQLSMLPRSVTRQPTAKKTSNGSLQNGQDSKPMDTTEEKPLSNTDFAKMFMK